MPYLSHACARPHLYPLGAHPHIPIMRGQQSCKKHLHCVVLYLWEAPQGRVTVAIGARNLDAQLAHWRTRGACPSRA
eukprot:6777799-Prymnesium_polylepis.1